MNQEHYGVILLNMGGPENLEDVHPFLYNLFSDRGIIQLGPKLLQKPLAWLIAKKRAPKSRAIYSKIGGGSPLKKITAQQAKALEDALTGDGKYTVTYAMRYWPPYGDEAVKLFLEQGVTSTIAVSLYPHFSKATSGSSLAHLKEAVDELAPHMPFQSVPSWPDQSSYIQALAENIQIGLAAFDGAPTEIVYSAHSLPVSFIEGGDPYVDHITVTMQEIEKLTGIKGRLCYQSRSGPVEWLAPSTPEMLRDLAQDGCKNILMVPISFVSDHIETLYEICILYKEQAARLGMRLETSESLNTNPLLIEGLRELILEIR